MNYLHRIPRCLLLAVVASCQCQAASSFAAGTDQAEWLFDSTRLIRVEITLSPSDWQELRISHRDLRGEGQIASKPYPYLPATVVIDGREVRSVGIRKKGFLGSSISTRPSLKIKFDHYVKNQEFAGLEMMTLNNNNEDPSQANQFLVYSYMKRAGVAAPRCSFTHVFVNGEDLGIYCHVESIRKRLIKRNFARSNGDLYEGIAGDFTTEYLQRITHKWGDDKERKFLKELVALIQNSGPDKLKKLEEVIDLNAFISFWVSEVLIGLEDGYAGNYNNWYLYRDRATGKAHFIPWGADTAFRDKPFLEGEMSSPKSVWARGALCRELWSYPEIRQRYQWEMRRQLDAAWDEEFMLSELDRVVKLTAEHRAASFERADREVKSIRAFVDRRRKELLAELDGPEPEFPILNDDDLGPEAPSKRMTLSGSFSTTLTGPMNFGFPDFFGETAIKAEPIKGKSEMTITIEDGTPKTLEQCQAVAGLVTGIREGYPTIQINSGETQNGQKWTTTIVLDPYQLHPGNNVLKIDLFSAMSIITRHEIASSRSQERVFGVTGSIKLDEFLMKPGSRISGSFELHAAAFRDERCYTVLPLKHFSPSWPPSVGKSPSRSLCSPYS